MKKLLLTRIVFILIVVLLFQLFSFLSLRNSILKQMDREIEEIYEADHPMNLMTVYVTNTGNKYHASYCQYLYSSRNSITLRKAVLAGYRECSVCITPKYVEDYNGIDTREEYIEAGYLEDLLKEYKRKIIITFRVIPAIIIVIILAIPIGLAVCNKKKKNESLHNLYAEKESRPIERNVGTKIINAILFMFLVFATFVIATLLIGLLVSLILNTSIWREILGVLAMGIIFIAGSASASFVVCRLVVYPLLRLIFGKDKDSGIAKCAYYSIAAVIFVVSILRVFF